MNPLPIKKIKRKWVAAGIILGVFLYLAFLFCRSFTSGGDGIVTRAVTQNGTEMCVIQKYTGNFAEPYRVGFYYRCPGKRWGWFYYDHEDIRWLSGDIKLSDNDTVAHIFCESKEVARFNISTESFTRLRQNSTASPAQKWMPLDWKPEDAFKSDSKSATQAGGLNRSSSYQSKQRI